MRHALLASLVLSAAGLGACAFFTDFPDVETTPAGSGGSGGSTSTTPTTTTMITTNAGGGGSGGSGGEGGMPPCEACRNCYPSIEDCPAPDQNPGFRIESVPDASPDSQTRIVWVTDAVAVGANALLMGTFGGEITAPVSLNGAQNQQTGFLMRSDDPSFSVGFGTCLANDSPNDDEVFMTAIAGLNNGLVTLAGGFEGSKLAGFDTTLDCTMNQAVVGPGPEELVPFLLWFNPTNRTPQMSLEPEISGNSASANGYISDVAALAGAADPNLVVAIGIADGDPFDQVAGTGADIGFYVISANGSSYDYRSLSDIVTCQNIIDTDLWGLRSSIAVDPAGDVWAAGASCPDGDGQSFLTRIDTLQDGTFLSAAETAVWGTTSDPIVITKVAISDSRVVIAGQYSGTPNPAWVDVPGFETGDQGDAFVMAFPLFEGEFPWNNSTLPLWFRRIRSDGTSNVQGTVDALIVGDGAVWISGRIAALGGIGNATGCYTSETLEAGRAYFAELDEVSGAVHVVRIDGFDLTGSGGAYRFARGTALAHPPNRLVSAVSSLGNLKLDCNQGTTTADDTPIADVRVYAF